MLKDYKKRWLKKTGEPMPESIAKLPLDKVRKAIQLTEADVIVVVPKELTPVVSDGVDSITEWDSHKEF